MADTSILASLSALAKALQLVAQAVSTATVTAASAQARLLTLVGLTAIRIAHSFTPSCLLKQCHACKQFWDSSCTAAMNIHNQNGYKMMFAPTYLHLQPAHPLKTLLSSKNCIKFLTLLHLHWQACMYESMHGSGSPDKHSYRQLCAMLADNFHPLLSMRLDMCQMCRLGH